MHHPGLADVLRVDRGLLGLGVARRRRPLALHTHVPVDEVVGAPLDCPPTLLDSRELVVDHRGRLGVREKELVRQRRRLLSGLDTGLRSGRARLKDATRSGARHVVREERRGRRVFAPGKQQVWVKPPSRWGLGGILGGSLNFAARGIQIFFGMLLIWYLRISPIACISALLPKSRAVGAGVAKRRMTMTANRHALGGSWCAECALRKSIFFFPQSCGPVMFADVVP